MNESGGEGDRAEANTSATSAPLDWMTRLADVGSAAQAGIPGLYAWAVTVAPAAWSRGAPLLAQIAALGGVASLAAALFLEHRRSEDAPRARAVAVWGLSLSAALTWLLVPNEMTTLRLDAARGFAGMLGWALFAFACAAPPVGRDDAAQARVVEGPPLRPRTRLARGDIAIMTLGAVVACALQVVGWRSGPPERAVLVRLIVIACGLAVLGGSTGVALARHVRRTPAPRKDRIRRTLPWFAALSVLLVVRLALWLFLAK